MAKRARNLEGKYEKTSSGKWKNIIRKTVGGKTYYITGTGTTQTQAHEAAQKNLESKGLAIDSNVDVKSEQKKTVKQSFEEFLSTEGAGWRPTTFKSRSDFFRLMILNQIGDMYVKELNAISINNMIRGWIDKYCNDNIKKSYNFLMKYLEFVIGQGIVKDFRKSIIKRPKSAKETRTKMKQIKKLPKIFTEEEYLKLLKLTETAKGNNLYYLYSFLVMLMTGMRGQELRALYTEDVNFKKHTIDICKAAGVVDDEQNQDDTKNKTKTIIGPTKTDNSTRIIGITPDVESYLLLMIEERPNQKNPLILQSTKGEALEKRSFEKRFDKILNDAGIEKLGRSPHDLRHTFISWAIGNKKYSPLKDKPQIFVSHYVGHNSLRTTLDVYAHVNPDELSDVPYNIEKI